MIPVMSHRSGFRMRSLCRSFACLALFAVLPGLAWGCALPAPRSLPREAVAAPLNHPDWHSFAARAAARARGPQAGQARVVFLGDSITHNWPGPLFRERFAPHQALNLGVPGDPTQSLLWRLRSADWPEALRPGLVVLLVGTNNLGTCVQAENIALGVQQNLL